MVFTNNSGKNCVKFGVDLNSEFMVASWDTTGSGCGQRRQKVADIWYIRYGNLQITLINNSMTSLIIIPYVEKQLKSFYVESTAKGSTSSLKLTMTLP